MTKYKSSVAVDEIQELMKQLAKFIATQKGQNLQKIIPDAHALLAKFVMDKADIPEDQWMAKRAALAAEHNLPGARNSSRMVLRLGCKLICSSNADPRRWLFRKIPSPSSWMTRDGVLPSCVCCGAIGSTVLRAEPCRWMRMSIKSTKLEPNFAYTDDRHKQTK
jgi:hypothetical protein